MNNLLKTNTFRSLTTGKNIFKLSYKSINLISCRFVQQAMKSNINYDDEDYEELVANTGGNIEKIHLGHKLIKCRPITPGLRHRVKLDHSELWKGKPIKSLVYGKKRIDGRNNQGRITVRGRGGGNKRRGRIVDFKRDILDEIGEVIRLEWAPDRTAHLALIEYKESNELRYIPAPEGLEPGHFIMTSRTRVLPNRPGNAMSLELIPVGSEIHCIEVIKGRGAQYARAAGTSGKLMTKNFRPGKALVRMVSGEQRVISQNCLATIGCVGNRINRLEKLGKAGVNRWRGRRPKVRGVAMNPVDHPHGGGEGKSKGRISSTPGGLPTKGRVTRKKYKRTSANIHLTRKKASRKSR